MFDDVGVFRTGEGMQHALDKVRELQERFKHVRADRPGQDLQHRADQYLGVGQPARPGGVTTVSALARTESRGAPRPRRFPKRDDVNWLKHTLAWMHNGANPAGLQAGGDHQIPAQRTRVLGHRRPHMEVTLKIFRFNPEADKKPHYETYKLEAEPTDRVLDLLEYVKGYL